LGHSAHEHSAAVDAGIQFTCFTGTKAQIVTQKAVIGMVWTQDDALQDQACVILRNISVNAANDEKLVSEGALQPLIKNLKAARKNVQAILILTSTKVLVLLVQTYKYGRKLWDLLQEQAAGAPCNCTQFTCFTSTKYKY
jgi:phosphatidylserine/phosphatidylglycerophosphate/cardiolipin synthase-like enzyme